MRRSISALRASNIPVGGRHGEGGEHALLVGGMRDPRLVQAPEVEVLGGPAEAVGVTLARLLAGRAQRVLVTVAAAGRHRGGPGEAAEDEPASTDPHPGPSPTRDRARPPWWRGSRTARRAWRSSPCGPRR